VLSYREVMAGAWEWVSDGEVRVGVSTSRLERTTSTVVIAGSSALLIDPCWEPDELAWIADDLAASGISVTAGFATHAHHDHLLWHPLLGAAPRWASAETARYAATNRTTLLAALGPAWPRKLGALVGNVTAIDGPVLPWDVTRVDVITHDAHAKGHAALWIPAALTLIAGDMLSDVELPLLEDSSPAEYAGGLAALRPYAAAAEVVIPGHGAPGVGAAASGRWAADNRYLTALIARTEQRDPRLGLPGMQEAHAHNRSRAAS
jgi:glyoxylase-like metal-dependent hydrolase (beta-lactamase superfamily II)